MKILYITPTIYDEGGIAKVLSLKTKYWVESCNYEVCFLTSNNSDLSCFHSFPASTKIIDIKTNGFKPLRILNYFRKVKTHIESIRPDVIIVCDFGWKGFSFNLFVKTDIPVIFEVHGSKFNETRSISFGLVKSIRAKLRAILLKTFANTVYLSTESQQEWNNKGVVIPNPIKIVNSNISLLQNKKAICLARHSFEKGIDRLLTIWRKVANEYPDWVLEIYGDGIYYQDNQNSINELGLTSNVILYKPQKNVEEIYKSASIYLMTSRQEGFPMVLLEAMSFGLPIIAYDCPVGPRSIITNQFSGFLIADGNEINFIEKIKDLMSNYELRKDIGLHARDEIKKFEVSIIMKVWDNYLTSLVSEK